MRDVTKLMKDENGMGGEALTQLTRRNKPTYTNKGTNITKLTQEDLNTTASIKETELLQIFP